MEEKIKVLMVDDEEQFRATTKKILDKRGFETIMAASGEEAIEKSKEALDVVVLDIKMPGIDGLEALKEIKKNSPDLPVIMLTGHGTEPSARQALREGAYDYLAKPCDIELLASKIRDAYRHGKVEESVEEAKVEDIMVLLEDYTTLNMEATVRDAIEELRASFISKQATSRLMETGHRSLLVIGPKGEPEGILTIIDLLKAILPAYLSASKPSLADAVQWSTMFWTGMFTRQVKELAKKRVGEIMSPAPSVIDAEANLMEAAHAMTSGRQRRLVVVKAGRVVGVLREQDLFFEMERVLRS